MEETICDAIENKKMLKFSYTEGERTVEPYCYGKSKTGKLVLRAFQVNGFSGSGEKEGWKLFSLEKISGLKWTGEFFTQIRPDYNPNDKGMIEIICNI
ncbi:MAG: WYL domain-containing protein [Acidaminococcaceae bacterium]|nr:WYL domain-containing protein [Acidaminococcaceae bacterium]MDD4722447.1 WYL domain-containing protein [Acidaminococcaceae bacterium]